MCRRHRLEASFTLTMMVRHAPHRLPALHRLFSRRHRSTVKSISPECDQEHHRKDWSGKHLVIRLEALCWLRQALKSITNCVAWLFWLLTFWNFVISRPCV